MPCIEPPETIICVDCGGLCHLLSVRDDSEPSEPEGTSLIVAYRCEDCLDRWDLEMSPDDD